VTPPLSKSTVTPFETVVRPIIGDDYDTAFTKRNDELDASLSAEEQLSVEALAELYVSVGAIHDADCRSKVRSGLISALKSLRKSAEARKKKADTRRAGTYRFRAVAPDGTELTYPKIGTKYLNRRYAMLRRDIPKPHDEIVANVKAHYAPYLTEESTEAYRAKIQAATDRDIAEEIRLQEDRCYEWRLWTYGAPLLRMQKHVAAHKNDPKRRFPYELIIVEGTPFEI